ncbi:fatty acid desaturase [Cystobacter fuscus]|uniref:fatty acid desaturase n=1 Tax=Cystobacter fuscus TaxID=43 RepID=UPI002B2D00C6|nr:fatty acid desaturase [Cystobacter fuscus]
MSQPRPLEFFRSTEKEPHLERARTILRAHPELKDLCGPTPITAAFVLLLVASQVGLAWALRDSPWWALLAAAWFVGAFLDHGLWVLIHECTHNLVFKAPRANALLQIFANLPILFPAAISFRKYHLIHHRFQGDLELDADLASPFEAKVIGNTFFGKAFWMLNFWAFQALRVQRLKRVPFFDGWYIANLAVQLAFIGGSYALLGPRSLVFMFLSSIFAIGLHPLGARWIQEHYLVKPPQETYSYYGPLNWVAFNVGYHNEHHDVMRVPWTRLPQVKKIAPEYYDTLHSHRSWTALWLKFLFDPSLSLYSRMTRSGDSGKGSLKLPDEPAKAA